jgi:hypothetical protein
VPEAVASEPPFAGRGDEDAVRRTAASIIATLPRCRLLDLLNGDLDLSESAALASLLSASPIGLSQSPTDPAKLSAHITIVNRQLAPLFGFPPIAVSQANDLIYSAV